MLWKIRRSALLCVLTVAILTHSWLGGAAVRPVWAQVGAPSGRVAVVVGTYDSTRANSAGAVVSQLSDVRRALIAEGFDVLAFSLNPSRTDLAAALRRLKAASQGSAEVIFYFSGRVITVDRQNYLLSIAEHDDPKHEVVSNALRLGYLVELLEARPAVTGEPVTLVMIDARRGDASESTPNQKRVAEPVPAPACHEITRKVGTHIWWGATSANTGETWLKEILQAQLAKARGRARSLEMRSAICDAAELVYRFDRNIVPTNACLASPRKSVAHECGKYAGHDSFERHPCGELQKKWHTDGAELVLTQTDSLVTIKFGNLGPLWKGSGASKGGRFFIGRRECANLDGFALAYVTKCPDGIPFKVRGTIDVSRGIITFAGIAPSKITSDCKPSAMEPGYSRSISAVSDE